jgi:hypothetical protein
MRSGLSLSAELESDVLRVAGIASLPARTSPSPPRLPRANQEAFQDAFYGVEPAQGARFGIPELPPISKLMASVSHLRANGLLAYKIESSEARGTYVPRIRRDREAVGNHPART